MQNIRELVNVIRSSSIFQTNNYWKIEDNEHKLISNILEKVNQL